MSHRLAIRVFYEDTDMGGIVYHANFLKFIERARSGWVRDMGVDQNAMRDAGLVFAVRRIEAEYHAPARLDDELEVRTETVDVGGARLIMDQAVWRGETLLFSARVTIACMTAEGRAARLPANIRRKVH